VSAYVLVLAARCFDKPPDVAPTCSRLMRSPSTSRVGVPFSARFHSATSGRNPEGTPVEGPRMVRLSRGRGVDNRTRGAKVQHVSGERAPDRGTSAQTSRTDQGFSHRPVMLREVVDLLVPAPAGVILDATVGAGGHAEAILDAASHLSLIGIDQDPSAVAAARRRLARFSARARVVHGRFDELDELLDASGNTELSAALFDLGVSSPQLDRAGRGFSYRLDGPLDMRMDTTRAFSASDVVNGWSEGDLVRLLREHGETRYARRIARAIIAARPLERTLDLASVVRDAIPAPARRTGGHPARRTFQAVRVAVNEELDVLPGALESAIGRLSPTGRCIVLAYHSGEDRIVKGLFRNEVAGGCTCPPALPCVCGAMPRARALTRGALRPDQDETAANPRSESARLRAIEVLP
jgi:16S rRNA (cytosine1402-N4)-methyltransferase